MSMSPTDMHGGNEAAGGGGGDSWTSNEYELDFAVHASYDIHAQGDGNVTVDSKTWIAGGMVSPDNTDDFQIVNGTGLQMAPRTTTTINWTGTIKRCGIGALISDLVSQFTDVRQTVDLQLLVKDDTWSTSKMGVLFGVEANDSPMAESGGSGFGILSSYIGSAFEIELVRWQGGTSLADTSGVAPASHAHVLGLRVHKGEAVELYYSTDADDYQTAFSGGSWAFAKQGNVLVTMNNSPTNQTDWMTAANLGVVIGVRGNNGATANVLKLWVKVWNVLE